MNGRRIAAESENWIRIVTLIQYGGIESCKYVLHTRENLPLNGGDLYNALQTKKGDFDKHLRKNVINQDQYDNIFPVNRLTDTSKWDITLFTFVIATMFGKRKYKKLVQELRNERNKEFHKGNNRYTNAEFYKKWSNLEQLFFNYGVEKNVIVELKTCALDRISQYRYDCVAAEQNMLKDRMNLVATTSSLVASVAVVVFCILLYVVLFSNTPSINSDLQQRLNRSSRNLRIHYNETIGKQNMKSVHTNHRSKKRFYVELSIESKTDTDQHLSNNDRSYHVMQQLNPKSKITIDQLIGTLKENNIVLIQGAGGIGKSYTLETAALHWAEGKIWQEMDFVFLLEFRMLNLYQNNNFSLKESIEKLYPSVFTNLKYDELLQEVGDRIIFLMDGLDEFANFNKTLIEANTLSPCNDSSISTGFYSLIQPKCFPGRKLVIAGRTSHCEQLRSSFKDLSIDSFNILGFSSIQVNEYIEHYFSNNTKVNGLKVVIKQSQSLQLMSRVPAFLWSLCELHQETSSFGDIATMTPIFAWQLTIFLRAHLRQLDEDITNPHPMDIFKNPEVKELVLHLSKIAEITLRRDEALISSSELDDRINIAQLETSGLLSRVKTLFGEKIQFNHMQMQEFLTSIHYISNPKSDYKQLLTSDPLSGAISFYAGLSGACLQNSNSSKDLQKFVMTLRICAQEQDIFAFPDHVFIHKHKLFLESLFEFQNNLSPPKFGFCDTDRSGYIVMQKLYNVYLKNGTTQPLGTSIVMIDCENAPKFYLLNEIVKEINSCDIQKFASWEEYFESCPLKENDLRLLLTHDFKNINDVIKSVKKTCNSTIQLYIDTINKRKTMMINLTFLLKNFPYNNCEIKRLKSMLLSNYNTLKFISSALQVCDGNREELQQSYNFMVFDYEELRKASAFEKQINETLTRKCQASVNHCDGWYLYLEQKETRYSTAQLVYFFKNFGHHYNGYIKQLKLVETLTSEETKIIAPHICNISRLYLFNSNKYQLEMLRIITQEILNCPLGSLIDTLVIDYLLLNRTFDCITTNEMPLKRIHNVENIIVRILSNTNRAFKLLRNNILQHHHLPSYKLRHLQIYTPTLTSQCCNYLTAILPFIEKITVQPFTGYPYPNYVVNYCKDVIGEKLHNKLPSDSRFDNIKLNNWELDKYSDWTMDESMEIGSEYYTDNAFLFFVIFVWGTVYTAICFFFTRKWYLLICFLLIFYLLEYLFFIPGSFFPEPIDFINLMPLHEVYS